MPFDRLCGTGSCWVEASSTKLKLSDPDGTLDGVEKAMLTAGDDGRARISIKAQTSALAAPRFALPVRAQLQTRGGACWEAEFDAAGVKRNETGRFGAVSAD
jgi:hypothetical protein